MLLISLKQQSSSSILKQLHSFWTTLIFFYAVEFNWYDYHFYVLKKTDGKIQSLLSSSNLKILVNQNIFLILTLLIKTQYYLL